MRAFAVGELAVSPNGRTSPEQTTGPARRAAIPAGQTDSPSASSVGGQISALGLSVNSVASQSNAAPASKSGMLADATPIENSWRAGADNVESGWTGHNDWIRPKSWALCAFACKWRTGNSTCQSGRSNRTRGVCSTASWPNCARVWKDGHQSGRIGCFRGERTLPVEAMGRKSSRLSVPGRWI